jgi:hypothetical protein
VPIALVGLIALSIIGAANAAAREPLYPEINNLDALPAMRAAFEKLGWLNERGRSDQLQTGPAAWASARRQ